jgi:hemolysin-activating ACP:hemolysin acyltransferase
MRYLTYKPSNNSRFQVLQLCSNYGLTECASTGLLDFGQTVFLFVKAYLHGVLVAGFACTTCDKWRLYQGESMWSRRRETQAEAADLLAQSQPPVPATGTAPETGASSEALCPGAGQQQTPDAEGRGSSAAPVPDEKNLRFWRGKLATANFGGAVSLFMRSPAYKHYTLADLEWCLQPALALNQFMAAEAKLPDGQAVPVALVLWARVSAEIDARLSAAPRYPIRLHPNEWQSGDAIWIIDALGEPKAIQQCVEALTKTAFQGKQFKMLSMESAKLAGVQRGA